MNNYFEQAKVLFRYAATAGASIVAFAVYLHAVSPDQAAVANTAITNAVSALSQISDGLVKLCGAIAALVPVALAIWGAVRSGPVALFRQSMNLGVELHPVTPEAAQVVAKAVQAPSVATAVANKTSVFLALIAAAGLLVSCTSAQVTSVTNAVTGYNQSLANFNAIATQVNSAIATTNTTVTPYCADALATGNSIKSLIGTNSKAATYLDALTNAMSLYCTAPPQNVGQAVSALANAVAQAKTIIQSGG